MIYLNSDKLATLHFYASSMSIFCMLEESKFHELLQKRDLGLVLINSALKGNASQDPFQYCGSPLPLVQNVFPQ